MDREVAFAEFVASRSPRLLRLAYGLTQDHALAEDLLQTALARSWSAWRRIVDDPEPYVRRVLVNTYNSWWRRAWRNERPVAVLPELALAGAQRSVDDHDEVWRALGRLPRQQRAVLVLRYLEDMSEEQTARLLSLSTGTVKSYSAKGLAKLRLDPSLLGPRLSAATRQPMPARLDEVRARVNRHRRGRLAAAGAAVALVLVLVLAYAVRPTTRESLPPTPPQPVPSASQRSVAPIPVKATDVPGFPEYTQGYRIVTGVAAAPAPMKGRPPLTFVWTPTTLDAQLYPLCTFSRDEQPYFRVYANGIEFGSIGCENLRLAGIHRPQRLKPESLAAAGIQPGQPTTITVGEGDYPLKVGTPSVVPSRSAEPGTIGVAIGEAMPFEAFPLPTRPAELERLRTPSNPARVLRAGTLSTTVVWDRELVLAGYSQTPGLIEITIDGKPLNSTMAWWDYNDGYIKIGTGPSYSSPSPSPQIGATVTIRIEPRFLTGDWYVEIGNSW
ncbi:SigE family RNA polymerase sigma factor [Longispora urticae]